MARSIATIRTVELAELLDFVRPCHRMLLATVRRDGRPQMSPVTGGVDSRDRVGLVDLRLPIGLGVVEQTLRSQPAAPDGSAPAAHGAPVPAARGPAVRADGRCPPGPPRSWSRGPAHRPRGRGRSAPPPRRRSRRARRQPSRSSMILSVQLRGPTEPAAPCGECSFSTTRRWGSPCLGGSHCQKGFTADGPRSRPKLCR